MSWGNWFVTRNIVLPVYLPVQHPESVKTSTTLQPKPESWHLALIVHGLDPNLCPFETSGPFHPVTHCYVLEEWSPSFKSENRGDVLK
jgi:hypothetical protein